MVMCVCSSWAGSTQLAKLTFKQFDAPFTLTWFATTWNCLFFPLYYIGHLCKSPERQTARQRLRLEDTLSFRASSIRGPSTKAAVTL